MIITSLSGSGIYDGNGYYHDITIEAKGSDAEYIELYRKVRCNKEVSFVDKGRNDAVDALCYAMQVVKPYKDTSPIKKVIFNYPATIVLWNEGTKTGVKCERGDTDEEEKGFYMCVAKKALGNKGNFNNEFKRWLEE